MQSQNDIGARLISFLEQDITRKQLVVASRSEAVAVLGIEEEILKLFGKELTSEEPRMNQIKKFIGTVVHVVLESEGWENDKEIPTPKSMMFSNGMLYRRKR